MLTLAGKFRLGLLSTVQKTVAMANHVYFGGWDKEGHGDIVVTDGIVIGVIPVMKQDGHEDEPGAVPVEAWNRAMSGAGNKDVRQLKIEKNWIKVNDDQGAPVVIVPRKGEDIPESLDYKRVIPQAKDQKVAVSIDPTRLAKLSRVLGSPERITLHMDPDPVHGVVNKPIRVTTDPWDGDEKPHGAILPQTIEKDRSGNELVVRKKTEVAKVA